MSAEFINPPDIKVWADSIGQLVINFGGLEFLAFKWMEKFYGREKALKTLGNSFSSKAKAIQEAIQKSNMEDHDKAKFCRLWKQAACFTKMRNRICHNPICPAKRNANGELSLSVVDLNRMDLSGEAKIRELNPLKIKMAANRVAILVRKIGSL